MPGFNWLDAYMTLAFIPATCLAVLASVWLLRLIVRVATLPGDKLAP